MVINAEKREITFNTYYESDVFVHANKLLLSQVIVNVLDNAVKYSENNNIVKVEVFVKENKAVLKVSDSGIGIPKNEIDSIFKRFYRAKNSNMSSGTGLGLAICKEIVEKYNGQMLIESALKEGTVVLITFTVE